MPAVPGAFAVMVKAAVPLVARPLLSVAVQYNGVLARVVYGNVIAVPPADTALQLTALTPLPVAMPPTGITEPVGISSCKVALVPEVVWPVLLIVRV